MLTDKSHAAAPRSGRRFWITVLCFAIANAAGWVTYDRVIAYLHRGTLRVEAFEPGDGAVVSARPNLRWRFSTDVIPTAIYGHDPASVTPKIAGRWSWDDPRTLVFTPEADLPRATRVRFALDQQFIRSGTGATLKEPYVAAVDSEPLELLDARQTAVEERDQYIIELKFNDRVAPGDVLQHLSMHTTAGQKVIGHLHGEAAGSIVRIRTDSVAADRPDADTELHVELSRGIVGLTGPLGIERDVEKTVTLARALAATDLKAYVPARGQPYLLLKFNNDVDTTSLKEVLTLDPATPYTIEQYRGDNVKLLGDFKPGTRYTLKLAAAPAGADRAKFPRAGQLAAFMPDRGSGVWFDNDQGYLSTAGNRALVVHAVNIDALHVGVTRMYDNNLVAWRNASQRDRWLDTENFSKPIAERTIKLPAQKNAQQDVRLSIDELLPAEAARDGVYRIAVDPVRKDRDESSANDDEDDYRYRYSSRDAAAVVTLSDIGLTAKQTRDGLVAWATSLRTTQPLANVRVRLFSNKNQPLGVATTDADGIATITGVRIAKDETAAIVLADAATSEQVAPLGPEASPTTRPTPATQLTWLDLNTTRWELGDADTSGRPYLRGGYEAFVYTDRGVFRPGETVHLRAIVRGPDQTAPATAFPVRWQLRRPDQRDWKSFPVLLNADGAATLDVQMPADLPTGQWTAFIGLPDEAGPNAKFFGSASFQIEEFLPNRLKSTLTFNNTTGDRFSVANVDLKATVQGDYLFGRPAAGLSVDLTTRLDRVPFRPDNWTGWTFGDDANIASPIERATAGNKHARKSASANANSAQPDSAALDETGKYDWSIDTASLVGASPNYRGPWRLTASSAVREAGGRAVSATKQVDLDVVPAYIGIRRTTLSAAQPGQPCEIQFAMVKPDGSAASGQSVKLDAQLMRASWNTALIFRDGRYHYDSTRVLEDIEKTSIAIDATGHGTWSPKVPSSGEYVLSVREAASGAVSSIEFDATDGSPWNDNVSRENPEHIDVRVLTADVTTTFESPADEEAIQASRAPAGKQSPMARIGNTVNVVVASPFAGRLLLSVETDNVVQTTMLDMKGSHVVVPVKVTDACRPNAFISAAVVRPIDPDAKWRTHRAFGVARLNVDPSDHRLNIALATPGELRPHQSLDIGITVTDHTGAAVRDAAITVAAVDEGICSLTNFATPDPLAFFTSKRALSIQSSDVFGLLMPEVPKANRSSSTGGDDGDHATARHRSPVVARRVKPVALAWAEVHTDENGIARASFPVPEFQGKLRVMAVGYAKANFGSADRGVTVRSPILAQTTWPRFAAPGDRFAVPIVLFNNTRDAGDVQIAVECADLMKFGDVPATKLAAGGQKQIELPVTIARSVGVAKIRMRATMNGDDASSFEENIELPIRPAAPSLQYGGYIAAKIAHPAEIRDVPVLMGGTDAMCVAVTPWPTLELPAGLDYLDRYPYGCVEQTTSSCFPLIALGDIGKTIDPARFDPERLRTKIEIGVTRLIGMQTADGGLAMWAGERTPWPWGSVYAAHFLTEARAAGYAVPDDFYRHLVVYVRHLLDSGTDDATELETQAYAAYVLAAAGRIERPILNRLTELASAPSRNDDPQDGYAMRSDARLMLSCAWLLAGRRDLAEGLIPQTLPIPRTHRQPDGNIGSPIRDRALLIQTLLAVQPDNPALPDLVQQLADAGTHREWASTHDTALAVLAIGRYLRDAKKHEPYDSAQLRLGEQVLASADAGGSIAWNAPPAFDASSSPLAVQITGGENATAHVSWLKTGVPLTPPPDAEHGMKVHRRYLSLDGQPIASSVRSGDLVRVELTIEAPPQQAGLLVEDMLPAGLEVENPRLETSARDHAKDDRPSDVPNFGDSRLDVCDDRVVIVGSMPGAWKARCTYLARAVTPGVYVMPPVRAEQMYDINVNALSGAGGTLTVTSATSNIATVHDETAQQPLITAGRKPAGGVRI